MFRGVLVGTVAGAAVFVGVLVGVLDGVLGVLAGGAFGIFYNQFDRIGSRLLHHAGISRPAAGRDSVQAGDHRDVAHDRLDRDEGAEHGDPSRRFPADERDAARRHHGLPLDAVVVIGVKSE